MSATAVHEGITYTFYGNMLCQYPPHPFHGRKRQEAKRKRGKNEEENCNGKWNKKWDKMRGGKGREMGSHRTRG